MKYISIINGPNLNRLGLRDHSLYGRQSLAEINANLQSSFPEIALSFFQSNCEGEIIDHIQRDVDSGNCAGIIINPGAYAHYSYAIADALRDAAPYLPTVEVHLSNIHARDDFRRRSVTAEAVSHGVIAGCGSNGYHLALRHLLDSISVLSPQ